MCDRRIDKKKKMTQSVRKKSIAIHIIVNIYLVWCLIYIYRHACAKRCRKDKLHSVEKRIYCKRNQVLRILLCELMYSTHHEIMRVVHDSSTRTNEKIIVNYYFAFTLLLYEAYTERSLKVTFFPYLRTTHIFLDLFEIYF